MIHRVVRVTWRRGIFQNYMGVQIVTISGGFGGHFCVLFPVFTAVRLCPFLDAVLTFFFPIEMIRPQVIDRLKFIFKEYVNASSGFHGPQFLHNLLFYTLVPAFRFHLLFFWTYLLGLHLQRRLYEYSIPPMASKYLSV